MEISLDLEYINLIEKAFIKFEQRRGHKRWGICVDCKESVIEVGKRCRNCFTKYDGEHRKNHEQMRRQKIRDFINKFKDNPCLDCGKSYPHYVMDFDHVRGEKEFSIGSAPDIRIGFDKLFSKIADEIKKCDLVCANCHRERTYLRNDWANKAVGFSSIDNK